MIDSLILITDMPFSKFFRVTAKGETGLYTDVHEETVVVCQEGLLGRYIDPKAYFRPYDVSPGHSEPHVHLWTVISKVFPDSEDMEIDEKVIEPFAEML
jgi:hypothetical protein